MASSSDSSPDADEHSSKRQRTLSGSPKKYYPVEGEEEYPTSYATSPLVTIHVGPKQHKFMIHKDVLIEKSPYFEKCLKPAFAEGQSLEITLHEDHVPGFEVFVTWIYKGIVEAMDGWDPPKQAAIEAWVLADKWCMHEFQNKILDSFQALHYNWVASAGDLLYLCQLHLSDSRLADYLFDQLAFDIVHHPDVQFDGKHPQVGSLELLAEERPDLAVKMMKTLGRGGLTEDKEPRLQKGCKYHVHGRDHPECEDGTN